MGTYMYIYVHLYILTHKNEHLVLFSTEMRTFSRCKYCLSAQITKQKKNFGPKKVFLFEYLIFFLFLTF